MKSLTLLNETGMVDGGRLIDARHPQPFKLCLEVVGTPLPPIEQASTATPFSYQLYISDDDEWDETDASIHILSQCAAQVLRNLPQENYTYTCIEELAWGNNKPVCPCSLIQTSHVPLPVQDYQEKRRGFLLVSRRSGSS